MEISESFLKSLAERRKEWAIGAGCVVAGVALLIGYFQSGPNALSYARAQSAFSDWAAAPEDEKLYVAMRDAIRTVPALERKYEPTIAQKLLSANRIDEALEMAGRSMSRVKGEAPYHMTYGETSLLIEQGNFQKALEKAVALKEQMGNSFLQEERGGSLLYAHNLLRIACLQRELNNGPGEKAAWEEVEKLLETKTPLSYKISANFSEKQVDLTQYIAARKKIL